MNTTNITEATSSGTVVALRSAGDAEMLAVVWGADGSMKVWRVEGAFELDAEFGRWTLVDTVVGDAPQNLKEAIQVGEAILTAMLEKRTVVFETE